MYLLIGNGPLTSIRFEMVIVLFRHPIPFLLSLKTFMSHSLPNNSNDVKDVAFHQAH